MSTSWQTFDALISRFPSEQRAIRELAALVGSGKKREMTFEHLVSMLEPDSVSDLAVILSFLEASGLVRQFVRVESPSSRGTIERFPSLKEVPNRIHDWLADEDIEVTPERLRLVYELQ